MKVLALLGLLALLGTAPACDKGGPDANPTTPQEQAASAVDGAALYQRACQSCHGPEGLGDGPAGAAIQPGNLAAAETQERLSDGDIAHIIRNGRGRMPPSGVTDDAEVQALVEYVRSLGP